MKTLTFVTGNAKKVATLERHIENSGSEVVVTQEDLGIIEPQADSAREVALSKARQAYAQLGRALVVDDSSFHIDALGGFPGPYVKYMLTTIGVEGIMKFMEGQTNRRAYFTSYLVYVDDLGKEHVFEDDPFRGAITTEIDSHDNLSQWSPLWKIFIADGDSCVLGQLSDAQWEAISAKRATSDAYIKFCDWLNEYAR